MLCHQIRNGDLLSIPAWSKVHRGNGPQVSNLVGQTEREQFPTDALESGAATFQLYSDPPGRHEQWECGRTFPSWQGRTCSGNKSVCCRRRVECDGVGTSKPEYAGNLAMYAAGHKD